MEMQNVLNFLKKLQENNSREWFDFHRDLYFQAKADFEKFTAEIIQGISGFDPEISGLQPKECIFRIYRDIRFSKDKTPYKNNFGASINKGGRKGFYAGYYIHIQPGATFAGGGIYIPPGDVLKKLRSEICYNTEEFKRIIFADEFKDHYGELMDMKLKNPPRGFDRDFPDVDLLKYKSYAVGHRYSDNEVLSFEFKEMVLKSFMLLLPLVKFLNRSFE